MSRFTERSIAYAIIATLTLAGAALVYWMYGNNTAQAQGTYELVMTFPESGQDSDENFGETFAPCRNQGNCNFSCGPSTVGRGCSTLVCSGTGGGDAAYFYTHSYVCQYTPPATPVCTPDTSCAANTCSTDTCTATASDCSQYQIGGTKNCTIPCQASNSCGQTNYGTIVNGSCSVSAPSESGCPVPPDPACSNGSAGPYPSCPLPPPTCSNGSSGPYPSCPLPPPTCSNGSAGPYPSCPLPDPDPTCADSGQLGTYPDCYAPPVGGGGTVSVSLTANPTSITSGNSSTLTWSSSNASSCTGGGFSTGGATSGTRSVSPTSNTTYTVSCTNGSSTDTDDATITVSGGACSGAGPTSITASPNRVQAGVGTPVTLSWTGSNIASAQCVVTNLETSASVKTTTVSSCGMSDSTIVPAVTTQTTFRLTCGTIVKDVVVNVVPRYEEF